MKAFILTGILIFLSIIVYKLLFLITKRTANITQYKINKFPLTVSIVSVYIAGVIGLLYILRVFNIYRAVDLKELYLLFKELLTIFSYLPFLVSLYLVSFCLLLILLILLLFLINIKYCIHQVFILYIYYYHSYNRKLANQNLFPKVPFERLYSTIRMYSDQDIITFFIDRRMDQLMSLLYGQSINSKHPPYCIDLRKFSKYHPYFIFNSCIHTRTYRFLIMISPLYFIIYDCIFNDFVIHHVFYYMILYAPVILLRRVTTVLSTIASYICQSLWKIYYSKEKAIYAISPTFKIVLDSYLLSGLRLNVALGIDMELYIFQTISFLPYKDNTFMNNEGICLQLTADNRAFEEKEDEDGNVFLGEEWILLVRNDRLL